MEVWATDKATLPRDVSKPARGSRSGGLCQRRTGQRQGVLLRYRSPTQAVLFTAKDGGGAGGVQEALRGEVAALGTRAEWRTRNTPVMHPPTAALCGPHDRALRIDFDEHTATTTGLQYFEQTW